MAIYVKDNQFHLQTDKTSYVMSVYDNEFLINLYWGKKLSESCDLRYVAEDSKGDRANATHVSLNSANTVFMTDLKFEMSVVGGGDYRTPMLAARYANGSTVTELKYDSYEVIKGKPALDGLPAAYSENDAETLEITLKDTLTGLAAKLCYTVFEKFDVITRNVKYINGGNDDITLTSALSATVDLAPGKYKVLTLNGDWTRERSVEWQPMAHTKIEVDSKRGMSSHMHNPFIAVAAENADEYCGNIYSAALVYSGSFTASAEKSSADGVRISIGINQADFEWNLHSGEKFQTPEAVLVYSDCGLNGMSQRYHNIFRKRLCRGIYRDKPRPIVINNWEGTYYDFNEDKIVEIAKAGAEIGLEMMVLDDGWFGCRDDDKMSLGDWYVDKRKLPDGLESLAKRINALGMKFGLWFEPEMISPDSDLYRAHPDWCIHADGRKRTENRWQLVLDLSRSEICDYVIESVSNILSSANIEYVKWDCNRNITETENPEQKHRYVLGLYRILETLTQRFPNILFESCSGGGGRFDAGMLYYMPQTWTSDNTNAVARMSIQYGTSMLYPISSMSSHIGAIDVGYEIENKYMNTCAMVAMSGVFGYEMDLSKLTAAELSQAKGYVDLYKKIRKTVQFGDFYRLESPFEGDRTAWMFVDDKQAVVFAYQNKQRFNGEQRIIYLKGLDADAEYEYGGRIFRGDALMQAGISVPLQNYDFFSQCLIFKKT